MSAKERIDWLERHIKEVIDYLEDEDSCMGKDDCIIVLHEALEGKVTPLTTDDIEWEIGYRDRQIEELREQRSAARRKIHILQGEIAKLESKLQE